MDEWNIGYLSYQKLLIKVALRYHVKDVITILSRIDLQRSETFNPLIEHS